MGAGRGGKGGSPGPGRGGRGRGSGGGYAKGSRDDDQHEWQGDRRGGADRNAAHEHRHPAVKFGDSLLAREVRPFPGADGSSFIKRRGSKNDTESLSLSKIGGSMTNVNSEWFNGRLAHAGSFLGANVEEAAKMLTLLGPAAQCPGAAKTGLKAMSVALTGPGSEEVMQSARLMNTSNDDLARSPQDMQKAAIVIFRFLKENERPMQKLACMTAKLLAFSMSSLEALAALSSRQQWADALHEQSELHNSSVKNFIREPKSDKNLVKAIATCYLDFVTERERSGSGGGGLFDDDEEEKKARPQSKKHRDREPRRRSTRFDTSEFSDDERASADGDSASDAGGLFTKAETKTGAQDGSLFEKPKIRGNVSQERPATKSGPRSYPDKGGRTGAKAGKSFDLPSESDAADDPVEADDTQDAIDAAIVEWGAAKLRAAHHVAQESGAQPGPSRICVLHASLLPPPGSFCRSRETFLIRHRARHAQDGKGG